MFFSLNRDLSQLNRVHPDTVYNNIFLKFRFTSVWSKHYIHRTIHMSVQSLEEFHVLAAMLIGEFF